MSDLEVIEQRGQRISHLETQLIDLRAEVAQLREDARLGRLLKAAFAGGWVVADEDDFEIYVYTVEAFLDRAKEEGGEV